MRLAFVSLIIFLAYSIYPAEAQFNNMVGNQALSIELSPAYPSPEETFTAAINDYALPVSSTGIRWYVDGKLDESALNERKISTTTKSVGKKTTIEAVLSLSNGGEVSVKRIINPAYLDIIIEPQTRTPAFYKGRALPSIESLINATAIINGNEITPSNLIYAWRLDDQVLSGGALRSKNSVVFSMPRGRSVTLSLDVKDQAGETLARRVIDLPSVSPDLSFYATSPLFGLTTKALFGTTPFIGNSLSIRAEPYYLDLRTFNNPDLTEWKLNGIRSFADASNPFEITLAKNENMSQSGNTTVNFHVRNTTQFLQGAESNFTISY